MKITVKIKPEIYKDHSKEQVLARALNKKTKSTTSEGYGYKPCWGFMGEDHYLYTYTIEKHNAKWEQQRYKTGTKKDQYKKSVKIRDKQWIVHLYKFDRSLLKLAKLKVNQTDNTFTIQKDKR